MENKLNCLFGCALSDILYYDPVVKKNSELKKGLAEFKFLLWSADFAIQRFFNGDYDRFDGLVGENACQIRAIKIAMMAKNKTDNFFETKKKIASSLDKVNKLLETRTINILMQQGCDMGQVLSDYGLDIQLSSDELFLIQSFLLNEMKECYEGELLTSILRIERCSPKMIQNIYPDISYSFLEKTAKKVRKSLSVASVEFVRQTASDLCDLSSIKMVSHAFQIEHNTLACVPCFWSFKTLFTLALKQRIPLLFHVKFLIVAGSGYRVVEEEFLYYKVSADGSSYLLTKPSEEELTIPCCIVQGVACSKNNKKISSKKWVEKIGKKSALEMLLCMGADHRQYPDPTTAAIADNEYQYYKHLAQETGFSLNNPTTFFVQHIYCSNAGKIAPPNHEFPVSSENLSRFVYS